MRKMNRCIAEIVPAMIPVRLHFRGDRAAFDPTPTMRTGLCSGLKTTPTTLSAGMQRAGAATTVFDFIPTSNNPAVKVRGGTPSGPDGDKMRSAPRDFLGSSSRSS
jgi:hypothetical protein